MHLRVTLPRRAPERGFYCHLDAPFIWTLGSLSDGSGAALGPVATQRLHEAFRLGVIVRIATVAQGAKEAM